MGQLNSDILHVESQYYGWCMVSKQWYDEALAPPEDMRHLLVIFGKTHPWHTTPWWRSHCDQHIKSVSTSLPNFQATGRPNFQQREDVIWPFWGRTKWSHGRGRGSWVRHEILRIQSPQQWHRNLRLQRKPLQPVRRRPSKRIRKTQRTKKIRTNHPIQCRLSIASGNATWYARNAATDRHD